MSNSQEFQFANNGYKLCRSCRNVKRVADFPRNNARRDLLEPTCRNCKRRLSLLQRRKPKTSKRNEVLKQQEQRRRETQKRFDDRINPVLR